jgi:dihydroflavonol-4-reductase
MGRRSGLSGALLALNREEVVPVILVTGATGFIGEQLVRRLVADDAGPVRILVRSRAKAAKVFGPLLASLDVAEGDLGDRESLARAVAGVDQVYHCASWIAYKGDWAAIWRVNVQGVTNLLDACLAAGVRRVVHMSSIAAGGPAVREAGGRLRPRTEADPPAPLDDPYGRSKLEQERAALAYGARGLEVVVVRPSAVFGPGDPAGINTLLKLVCRGRLPFYLGAKDTLVNVVPVQDVVAGCIAAMARGRAGEAYHLVGPDLTHAELFRLLAEVSGGRAPSFVMPRAVLLTAAGAVAGLTGWWRTPPVHPNDIRSWTAPWAASGAKARAELGLEPTDLRQAWAETHRWLEARTIR